jgi:hypothetical protein
VPRDTPPLGSSAPVGTPLTASVGGLPIFLPDTARGGYVYQDTILFPTKVSESVFRYDSSGAYYDVPTTVFWQFTTNSAGPPSRFAGIEILDQGGNRVMRVQSPAAQALASGWLFTFSCLVGAPVDGSAGNTVLVPYPTTLMAPGWRLQTFVVNVQGVDTSPTVPTLSRVRFQTGSTPPADAPPQLAPVETPVLA